MPSTIGNKTITSYKILAVDDDDRQILAYKNLFTISENDPFTALENFFSTSSAPSTSQVNPENDITLITAKQGEQAIELVKQALVDNHPVSVAFIDMRMPPGLNGLQTALKLRELDPRIYIVIVTAYSDIDLKEIVRRLGDNVLFLRKPFQAEEVEQIAYNFVNAWKKDESLRELQAKLTERIRLNLFEASIFEIMNPVLISLADKVNAQSGLISYLEKNSSVKEDHETEFDQVFQALSSEAHDLTYMIKVLQQLVHPNKEIMAFTAKDARHRFYSLIPELQQLPANISFKIRMSFDLNTTFHLPENYLLIVVMALVRHSLSSVTAHLLDSSSGTKGEIRMLLELSDGEHLEDQWVTLTIKDNGKGLDAFTLKRLRNSLSTLKEYETEFYSVGFSMVREFIEYVGGKFSINSDGLGKGQEMILTFPVTLKS